MNILVVGSGIAGLSCALEAAKGGAKVTVVSTYQSERAQSVMAAGGINAALDTKNEKDSVSSHINDTMKGGCNIASRKAVEGLCSSAPEIISFLESIGVVFTRDENGQTLLRAFGGQSHKRTCFAGASTGKQIVSALVRETRKYEYDGRITRLYGYNYLSALIDDDGCHGAVFQDENTRNVVSIYADATVLATGGQNCLFGKTTGTVICDGSAAADAFCHGASLKNLEFIQFHPTTMETPQKMMLVSEAVRGEGGRLFYLSDNSDLSDISKRVYFMEYKYGANGNLMTRDVISREMYNVGRQVYLDVSFIGKKMIMDRLPEVYDTCLKYGGIDITKSPVPVSPSVHFFMGGISVDKSHRTGIDALYAAGECAAIYHGANRLGGNSLLGAIYGGRRASDDILGNEHYFKKHSAQKVYDDKYFDSFISGIKIRFSECSNTVSHFPVVYIQREIARIMNQSMGVVRCEKDILKGLDELDFYTIASRKLRYNGDISAYHNYTIANRCVLAKACLLSALERKESRGAHNRLEYPETSEEYEKASVCKYHDNDILINYVDENKKEGNNI